MRSNFALRCTCTKRSSWLIHGFFIWIYILCSLNVLDQSCILKLKQTTFTWFKYLVWNWFYLMKLIPELTCRAHYIRLIDWFIVFNATFSYIMATSFSGGRSRSSRREPPTMQLVNFITCGCESSAPFFVIYKAGREPTISASRLISLLLLI
jgi:hypothetical protein